MQYSSLLTLTEVTKLGSTLHMTNHFFFVNKSAYTGRRDVNNNQLQKSLQYI